MSETEAKKEEILNQNQNQIDSEKKETAAPVDSRNIPGSGYAKIKAEFLKDPSFFKPENLSKLADTRSSRSDEQNSRKRTHDEMSKKDEQIENSAENEDAAEEEGDEENNKDHKKRRGQNKNRHQKMSLGVDRTDFRKSPETPSSSESSATDAATTSESSVPLTFEAQSGGKDEINILTNAKQQSIRKSYDFSRAQEVVKHIEEYQKEFQRITAQQENITKKYEKLPASLQPDLLTPYRENLKKAYHETKLKPKEIKQVDFKNKLVIAPLATVGNIPFRRIMKKFGADITMSEMICTPNILSGQRQEISLLRRHADEDVFGIQITGPNLTEMSKVVQLFEDCRAENPEQFNYDFIDCNCGCPVDAICLKKMGCEWLRSKQKLVCMARGLKEILSVPLTIKMRTRINQADANITHKYIPFLCDAGVNAMTVHGRSKQQRYAKLADWAYINQCASVAAENGVPLMGNGDILSYHDIVNIRENYPKVSSFFIARGALIKPWICQEIKKSYDYDISSSERLDILKDFVKFGMDHWGSDPFGIENTRRYLLEWLSFLCRYVPVGILEKVPQKINERPPPYFGRNDLETLMASDKANDWIKITELVLPKTPENFVFIPKHKSSSYQ